MSDLETRAQGWVERVHPHAKHLIGARDRVVELVPAREELRMAALLHDIERAFPDEAQNWNTATAWEDPTYLRWHQDRSGRIASEWLLEQGAGEAFVSEVDALIRVHEDGGWDEADVLQAADSLSFFDTMTDLTLAWAAGGQAGAARRKLHYTHDRIRFEPARSISAPLLEHALEELDSACR